ncbi:MAG: hypothetical protein OXH36_03180 [Bdellovibrionales bacterium]|nr:hypothetical protein [Bdellovibrionales bacterium]
MTISKTTFLFWMTKFSESSKSSDTIVVSSLEICPLSSATLRVSLFSASGVSVS